MMEKLLPCPFCGDPMYFHARGHVFAHVDQCDCPIAAYGFSSEKVAAWNARHPPAPLMSDEMLSDIAYNAEQIANYIAIPNPSEKHLASARWHNNKIRAALQALSHSEKEISDE